ncbi:MAG: ATP synthase F1 subunit epsilon [Clostridium sp.]|uniref:ATP synthase F1 subunit epsilon n=1 Tax=Clostridium sp. DSM 8431 TaxID=1761781 RepID=UPI0008E0A874|nr:ATP synthase F1 subunit epsilon [Clostridium sp. DSM 8431]MCR4943590.1 ATP synthase F1 subunit epsilon [Clostridium sp.]SFU49586.1 F-type H+-transporting ATPase subunit epsilon [Clostridium sp. DSM 8431]
MADRTLNVKIITLNNIVTEDEVTKVFLKSKDGGLEIMPGHAPIIVSIIPNITVIEKKDGSRIELFTSKGVVSLEKDNLSICCDAAEAKDEIDLERAKRAMTRAEERLSDPKNNDVERAKLALMRSMLRIDFKEGKK